MPHAKIWQRGVRNISSYFTHLFFLGNCTRGLESSCPFYIWPAEKESEISISQPKTHSKATQSDSVAVRKKILTELHRVKHWPKYQQKQEAWVLWNSVQHMSEGFLGLHKTVVKEKIGKADVRCLLTPDETCPFLYPFEMFNRYVGADF